MLQLHADQLVINCQNEPEKQLILFVENKLLSDNVKKKES